MEKGAALQGSGETGGAAYFIGRFHVKRLALFLFLAFALFAQTAKVVSYPDLVGNAAAQQISTTGTGRWIILIADSSNGAAVRCGDSTASATKGAKMAAGGGLTFPAMPVDTRNSTQASLYALSGIYCYAASNDKVSITVGQ